MAEIIITSFFTENSEPVETLTPTIRIREVNKNVIAGVEDGYTLVVDDNIDNELDAIGDGFYRFVFDTPKGYDPSKSYVFRVDGGSSQPLGERYQAGELNTAHNTDAVIDSIYDEPKLDHLQAGTFGESFNQTNANIANLSLAVGDVEILVDLLLKFETNRTRIDGPSKTMTIYDDDGITPLRTFSLRDGSGAGSIEEVCERMPITDGTSDGRAVP